MAITQKTKTDVSAIVDEYVCGDCYERFVALSVDDPDYCPLLRHGTGILAPQPVPRDEPKTVLERYFYDSWI